MTRWRSAVPTSPIPMSPPALRASRRSSSALPRSAASASATSQPSSPTAEPRSARSAVHSTSTSRSLCRGVWFSSPRLTSSSIRTVSPHERRSRGRHWSHTARRRTTRDRASLRRAPAQPAAAQRRSLGESGRQGATSTCFSTRWRSFAIQRDDHLWPRKQDRAHGERISAPAALTMLKSIIIANNRAGGWRKLKREAEDDA